MSVQLCNPVDRSLPGSTSPGFSLGKNIGAGCHAFLQGHLPVPKIEPASLTSFALKITLESPGKPTTWFRPIVVQGKTFRGGEIAEEGTLSLFIENAK